MGNLAAMGPHCSDTMLQNVVEKSRGQLYPWCSESYGILSRDRKSVGGKKNGILSEAVEKSNLSVTDGVNRLLPVSMAVSRCRKGLRKWFHG